MDGTQDLLCLIYFSLATEPLSEAAIEALATTSRTNNAAVGITGLLLVQGPYFYGIMEGHQAPLFGRMEAIIRDRRHRLLRVLREQRIPERRFVGWHLFRLPSADPTADERPNVEFILNMANCLR